MVANPVFGFEIVKTKQYLKDCERYKKLIHKIINTELK